jgi:iron complex outermembrane recepter protein
MAAVLVVALVLMSEASAESEMLAPEGNDAGVAAVEAPAERHYSTVVRARALKAPVSVGDVRVELGLLGERPRRSGSDLLLLAPSVLQTQHGGEGHAPQLYVRGIDSGEGKDLELRVDGVPLNEVSNAHGHGYADTYFLIPELVAALRITEGPFEASQGDFAVAGTAEYELALERRGVSVSGEYGRFSFSRLTALWGPGENPASFIGLTLRQGSGFGPNRGFANGSLLWSHELSLSADAKVRLLGGFSAGRFDSAGVLRESDVEARNNPRCGASADEQFYCFVDANQGGAQQRHFVSAKLTQRIDGATVSHQLFALWRQQRLRENFTGFVNDTEALTLAVPQRGDGVELDYGGFTGGARGSWQRKGLAVGEVRGIAVDLGYFARVDVVESASRRLRAADGAPYKTVFDGLVRASNLALFAQGRLPLGRVTLRGGLRLDAFLFSVEDRNRPASDRTGARLTRDRIEAWGLMPAPRLTAEVALLDGLSWSTAVGLGSRSSDAAALSDTEFAPFALVVSAESGLSYLREGDVRIEGRAAAFAVRVERDIVFSPEAGRNQVSSASARAGLFALGRLGWGRHFDVLATVSYTQGHQPTEGRPWWALFDGPALPYLPRLLARIEVVGAHELSIASERFRVVGSASAWLVGARPLPLERWAEPALVLEASARAEWRWFSLGLAVENLLDTRWRQAEFNYPSHFEGGEAAPSRLAARHFAAAPPRQWRLLLGVHFE